MNARHAGVCGRGLGFGRIQLCFEIRTAQETTVTVVLALPSSTSTQFHTLVVSHLKSGMYFIRAFDTSSKEQFNERFEIIR